MSRHQVITLVYFILVVTIYLVPFLNFLGPFKVILAGVLIAQYFGMKEQSPVSEMGLSQPNSWMKTIGISLILAALIFLVRAYFVEDWIYQLFPVSKNLEGIKPDTGEPINVVGWIVLMFFFAAVPEELVWRGFLVPQLAAVLGGRQWAWWTSILAVSFLFGLAHNYQGPAGVASTFVGGLAYGMVYYLDNKSVWKVIFVHWLVNSYSIIADTLGW